MEKIEIRMATVEDIDKLLAIYQPYVLNTAVTFEYEVPTREEFKHRIVQVMKKFPYLVAQFDDEILGYAYASPFKDRAAYDWSVETSIYVKMDERKKSIGRMLHEKLEYLLKEKHIQNMNACIAYLAEENSYLSHDSIYFHEKMGYKQCAHFSKCGYKNGVWYDMIWMEKLIGEHEVPPALLK